MSAIQIFGPTASGKSALAEHLAQRFDLQLLSVDSALVYRRLDIGSAKPPLPIRDRYELIDLCEPEEAYSAARFVADATDVLQRNQTSERTVLLVGGTGLYFRALNEGLSHLPAADPQLRAELAQRLQLEGAAALHAQLAQLDPAAALRIHAEDTQRVSRALEVIQLTGRTLSSQQTGPQTQAARSADLRIAFAPNDRAWLHQRIEQRLAQMFAAGFIEEVRELMARPALTSEHPSMRAVGYRQVWNWLAAGSGTQAQAQELALYATRQLAKRQYTWLRSERDNHWLDAAAPDVWSQAERLVTKFLQC